MKFTLLTSALLLLSPLGLIAQETAQATKEDRSIDNVPEELKAFMNLDEEERKEFAAYIAKANKYFGSQRIIEALGEITKAELIFKSHPTVHNLRGSCYVHLRDFVSAEKEFKRALKITPKSSSILFNIAEMHFVTERWESCATKMDALNKLLPDTPNNKGIKRLVEFKLLLSYIKLNRLEEAKKLAELYDMWDDSPYYYYAQAALNFSNGEKIEADQILKRARRVFRNPATLSGWDDTLTEFGYIKSFYGGDEDE